MAMRHMLGNGGQLPLLPPTLPTQPVHLHPVIVHHPVLTPTPLVSHINAPDELRVLSPDDDDEEEDGNQTIVVPNLPEPEIPKPGANNKHPADVPRGGLPPPESALIPQLSTNPWTQSDPSIYQQMRTKSRAAITILSALIAYVSINSLARALNPSAFIWYEEDREESDWVSTSHSWWDRKACRWLSLCGATHFRLRGRFGPRNPIQDGDDGEQEEWESYWKSGNKTRPEDWTNDERRLRTIPDYVLEYAPLVHLFSEEQFWPSDIAKHLYHITPELNYTPIQAQAEHPTLANLSEFNKYQGGKYVFLTSKDNVEDRPSWLGSEGNIPKPDDTEDELEWQSGIYDVQEDVPLEEMEDWYDARNNSPQMEGGDETHHGSLPQAPLAEGVDRYDFMDDGATPRPDKGGIRDDVNDKPGRSKAPAVLIVVDKGHGIVDAFWFYFYSFNLGNKVLNIRFGNHVGDWEHSLVRFHNGTPKAIYFSEHSFGEAFSYDAVEKMGKRPVIYSASGTHAMYATPGTHAYILPWGLLHDRTDRGPLWDPARNYHGYTYDHNNDVLRASTANPQSPTAWFYFAGHWGDKFYPLGDRRQYRFVGQYHYVNGPYGPRFKELGRDKICGGATTDPCVIKNWIGGGVRSKRWVDVGEGEELRDEDIEKVLERNGATPL
ncbi:vacuolar protein sorting protein 62 [Histoplasma ohiense]|nr:vacuolar protein sorting protein 62 [Histoplasma ohiense (nom. inval.)]